MGESAIAEGSAMKKQLEADHKAAQVSRVEAKDAIAKAEAIRSKDATTSLLQPLKPRTDFSRSPSTPAPIITRPKTLRQSGSKTLLAGNGVTKAAWGEKLSWSEVFASKDGAIGNANQYDGSSKKAAYWEPTRGLSRTNRLFGKVFVEFDRC